MSDNFAEGIRQIINKGIDEAVDVWRSKLKAEQEEQYKMQFSWQEEIKGLKAKLDKPITEHSDVQRLVGQVVELQKNLEVWRAACGNNEGRIEELQAEKEAVKTQYAKDLVATNTFYFPKPVCENQLPEITSGYNACLSCPMRKTCLLIFKKP